MKHCFFLFTRPAHTRPVVITIFTIAVRASVSTFHNQAKLNRSSLPVVYGLAEWIIDDSCPVHIYVFADLAKEAPNLERIMIKIQKTPLIISPSNWKVLVTTTTALKPSIPAPMVLR